MDIVKKNLISIIFGVVAVLAIAADFYPMAGKREQLKTEATEHAKKAEELKNLMTKPRKLPVVKLGSTEDEPLPGFPTHQALEVAHQATERVNTAAEDLMKKASGELNIHVPLVDRALPGQPGDAMPASRFARAYMLMFPPPPPTGTITAPPPPVTRPAGSPPSLMDLLHSVNPPSDVELTLARNEKQDQVQKEVTRYTSSGQVTNQDEVVAAVQTAVKAIGDEMRTDRAKKAKVWVWPDAFSIYPGMNVPGVQPDPINTFWAQIGLWTQEDICKAIYDLNESSSSVMEAPVKILWKISFLYPNQPNSPAVAGPVPVFVIPNLPPAGGVGTGGGPEMAMPQPGAEGGAAPATPPMDPNAPLDKKTLYSPTGRISNGLFDVEHFEVELVVDAAKVSQVLEGLGAKRYISVIQLENIETIDLAYLRGAGYYCGSKPCVKIKVRCEELFFRSWLTNYVPTRLKPLLGYPPPAAPPPPA